MAQREMMLGADRWAGHSLAETAGNCGKPQGKRMDGRPTAMFIWKMWDNIHDELYYVAILLGTMWEYYDQA